MRPEVEELYGAAWRRLAQREGRAPQPFIEKRGGKPHRPTRRSAATELRLARVKALYSQGFRTATRIHRHIPNVSLQQISNDMRKLGLERQP